MRWTRRRKEAEESCVVGIEMAKEVEGIFTGSSRKIGKGGDGEHYWGVRDGPLELRVLEDRRGIMRGSGLGKGNVRERGGAEWELWTRVQWSWRG